MLPFLQWSLIILLLRFSPIQQSGSGISQPQPGDTVSGVVAVVGTAVHPDYLRYELAFLYLDGASDWIVFAEGDQQVVNGTLAEWDTTVGRSIGAPVFPDGRYQLRLRVVKRDFNYDEYFVTDLLISNDGPTPTPRPDQTAVSLTAAALLAAPPTQASGGETFQQATQLPSLTPLPAPTPQPTSVGNSSPVTRSEESSATGGVLGQLRSARWGRVGTAFLLGVIGTALLFSLGILYLLLRAIGRRLWRMYYRNR